MRNNQALIIQWTTLVRKIWDNPELKKALFDNPRKFLTDNGFEIDNSQTIEIHENTPDTLHLILPEKPPREIPDEILSHIVAGI